MKQTIAIFSLFALYYSPIAFAGSSYSQFKSIAIYRSILDESSSVPSITFPHSTCWMNRLCGERTQKALPKGRSVLTNPMGKDSIRIDPSYVANILDKQFEYRLGQLPLKKEIQSPWPGPSWVAFNDSINYRYDQESPSPSEKYALAFEVDASERISRVAGIESGHHFRPCKVDLDCAIEEVCAAKNSTFHRCMSKTLSLGHAWSTSSYLEPEPEIPVIVNGVKFEVLDIKALLAITHHYATIPVAYFASTCSYGPRSVDRFARPIVKNKCIPLNAGIFHLILTNWFGRYEQSFSMDSSQKVPQSQDSIRAYEVVHMHRVSRVEATRLFDARPYYPFNDFARYFVYVETNVYFTPQMNNFNFTENVPYVSTGRVNNITKKSVYKYLLELNSRMEIIGGEWLGNGNTPSVYELYIPLGKPSRQTSAGGITYENVQKLLVKSLTK